ncbi:MAG: amidophosphoribosyltransferase [Lachnospiraceae bacterium]|nr:amidophosphoribosyltransferase [Lachnospiraceae bacterium]
MSFMDKSDMDLDKLHEECGVFGIYSPEDEQAAHTIYYGLSALQHRGQEAAGMAVYNTGGPMWNVSQHKGMGLVNEVFHNDNLDKLIGNLGVGHVRYSTTGESSIENAQPLVLNYFKGTLALVHNGNITNTDTLKEELKKDGAVFYTSTDSEVIACEIAVNRIDSDSVEQAIIKTAKKLKGGYALIVMSPRKLIGVRDPLGLKPLCLGKRGESYILASESCALTSVDAEFVRDIKPGEIITISPDGIKSDLSLCQERHAHCIFEYIYFARLDSVIDGINVYDSRINAGKALARAYPIEADLVVGVPDSGVAAAKGYSEESGIPFGIAFHKNSYVGRTFIKPTQEERESAVHMKLSVIKSVVKDKRIVLIDDSIVRGTTMANLINMLKSAGAKSVHVRISSPPFLYPCYYGTDVPSQSQLIASKHSSEDIRKTIGADSLGYMRTEDFKEMVGDLPICMACFNNNYPV